ncbi:hypothetical protein D3C71_920870 [compost metagenome]
MGKVRAQQLHIAQSFDPDAPEAHHQHRAPLGIPHGTDHKFQAARAHGFHQHPIQHQCGVMPVDVFLQLLPGCPQLRFVLNSQHHATGFGLVRQLGSLGLEDHGIANACSHGDSLLHGRGQITGGSLQACGLQQLLAAPLRQRPCLQRQW